MSNGLVAGSFFSGVGGIDLAFMRAGFSPSFQVENDPNCQRLLRDRFPDVPLFGDISKLNPTDSDFGGCDVFFGGFPCQDLSVAGRGRGLAGSRSGLWWAYYGFIAVQHPQWVVIENVPGLLSSNSGRDFAVLLHALENIGYGVAWRVFDAQYFGVPQRRRRVFIVGHIRDVRRPVGVLFGTQADTINTSAGYAKRAFSSLRSRHHFERDGNIYSIQGGSIAWNKSQNGFGITENGPMYTLDLAADHAIAYKDIFRRLTPLEYERLQGFPDNWTHQFSDRVRYRMMGNAVAVPVLEWIANRIRKESD